MPPPKIFHGALIYSRGPQDLKLVERGLLYVDTEGVIRHVEEEVAAEEVPRKLKQLGIMADFPVRWLGRGEFVAPGFVDTHAHACQWAQRGLGQGMHILDWLERVTFRNEARFADAGHARRVYGDCVGGLLRQGITAAAYYGSLHAEATKELVDACVEQGQRALVGKTNMNRGSPEWYRDASAAASLRDTRDCIAHARARDPAGRLVRYAITPRFAVTCDEELLEGLGQIARENPDLPIQTHFEEAEQEVAATRALFPDAADETDLYARFGLLQPGRTILAHCCLTTTGTTGTKTKTAGTGTTAGTTTTTGLETEHGAERLAALGCGVAHCPVANATVGGGFMAAPVRGFLRAGVAVGLGTDVGGGFSASMLDAMRQALIASNAREAMTAGADEALTVPELFYLATLGGARVCGLSQKVGSLEVGKEFDALVVGPGPVSAPVEEGDSLRDVFEKFVMTGDDRNIRQVFVAGRLVKS